MTKETSKSELYTKYYQNDKKKVKGCIIANEDDQNMQDALEVTPGISFMRYELKFNLISSINGEI